MRHACLIQWVDVPPPPQVRRLVLGPVLVGVGEGLGNLPRGLYIVDGVHTMEIGPDGHKSVTMVHGSRTDICARID